LNLLGESFPQEVIDQIDQRQKIYGSGFNGERSLEQISYLNSNSSWCKLVSSVNINSEQLPPTNSFKNLNIGGTELAKRMILFNGISEENQQNTGIDFTNSILNNNVYGIGGNEFGLNPMMGITSATIKHENAGSLKKATVNIKAYNRKQFEIIDMLYLRLGFSILLEWGHSLYYDNTGKFQTNTDWSLSNDFLKGDKSYLEFLDLIRKQRLASNGNYDAMFGKVTNMHWSILSNGSYDIRIDIISVGDIVESLKINTSYSDISNPSQSTTEKLTPSQNIIKSSGNGKIEFNIFKLKQNIDGNGMYNSLLDGFKQQYNGDKGDFYYFVRLGSLLKLIQTEVIFTLGKPNKQVSSLQIDYDAETNLMYTHHLQASIDPSICLLLRDIKVGNKIYSFNKKTTPQIISNFDSSEGKYIGKIMNIYLNTEFILGKIKELKNEKNKTTLIDFINGILNGINGAIGGINNFEAFIDDDTNTLKILDKTPIPEADKIIQSFKSKYSGSFTIDKVDKEIQFELFGYNKSNSEDVKAGFISNFNFTTELNPEFSTMITVGAVSNNKVVGENSTSLSRLNYGFVDRYKEEANDNANNSNTIKVSPYQNTPNTPFVVPFTTEQNILNEQNIADTEEVQSKQNEIKEKENKILFTYFRRIIEISNNKDDNSFDVDYKDLLSNFLTNKIKAENLTLKKPVGISPSFIPFNLSLKFNGLSGIKINSKFKINTDFLPSNYPESVEFLVRGLTHTIQNNKWECQLDSYCISKGEFFSEGDQNIEQSQILISNLIHPNAKALKEYIGKLGYTVKGQELDNRGDITPNLVNATKKIFTDIYRMDPTIKIEITSGNDNFHNGGKHHAGLAIDFVIRNPGSKLFSETKKDILNILGSNPNLISYYQDEYEKKSEKATEGHIHFQIN